MNPDDEISEIGMKILALLTQAREKGYWVDVVVGNYAISFISGKKVFAKPFNLSQASIPRED